MISMKQSWIFLFLTQSINGFQNEMKSYSSIQSIKSSNRLYMSMSPMSSMSPMKANLAVALDQPVIPFSLKQTSPMKEMMKRFLAIVLSDAFKTALVAFCLALLVSIITKSPTSMTKQTWIQNSKDYYKLTRGKMIRLWKNIKSKIVKEKVEGIPILFDKDMDGNDTWNVCTLLSKTRIGNTNYIQYDFQLPQKDNTIPLALGQQLQLCCLNNNDEVTKGGFYLKSSKLQKGSFSIVAPKADGRKDRVIQELGVETARFASTLDSELKLGDEVAMKPGNSYLNYRGEHYPITDMIYFVSGMGIVPILHQIQAILPTGSSSVKMVTVVWMNDESNDFEIAFQDLEEEYFKYNLKLEVSCVIDSLNDEDSFISNKEVDDATPLFRPGSMAVISGPELFKEKAKIYLMDRRDYPENCLCELG